MARTRLLATMFTRMQIEKTPESCCGADDGRITVAQTCSLTLLDVLEVDTAGARWVDREQGSACAAIP